MLPLAGLLLVLGSETIPASNAPGMAIPASLPPAVDAPAATEDTVEYYGREILLVDGTAVALILLGGLSESDTLGWVGLATAGFGGAAVHVAHGNPGRALGSAAMRVSLTYGGAAIGFATATCYEGEWFCGFGEAAIGALIGYGTSVAIDAGYLAHHTRKKAGAAYYPRVAASPNGVQVGLGGTF